MVPTQCLSFDLCPLFPSGSRAMDRDEQVKVKKEGVRERGGVVREGFLYL